jgi:hypothetical protein
VLALLEREFAEVSAVELEEIERPDAKLLVAPLSEVERAKIRKPPVVACGELAIDDGRAGGESCDRGGNCA